jgi:hypothetical protein
MLQNWANGQEVVLTQPFSVSQYQNAAAAGSGSYDERIQMNYRNPVIDGERGLFETYTFAYDSRIGKEIQRESLNYFGYGLQFVNDRVMNGVMQNNYFTLNTAYHIFLDDQVYSQLSGGIGLTYTFTSLDRSRLRFGDQFDYRDILSYTPSLEYNNLAAYNGGMSFNAALMHTYHSNKKFIQTGVMVYKYDKPNVTFSPLTKASDMSYRVFANADLPLTKTEDADETNSVLLNLNYLNSGKRNQLTVGGMMGLKIIKDYDEIFKIYVGCIYKLNQSISPTIAILKNRYTYGFSYDSYNTDITSANIKMSAFEFTISKKGGITRRHYASNRPGRMKTLFD